MCTKKNTFKGEFSYIFWDLEEGGFFQGFEKIHALFLGIKGPLTCPGGGGGSQIRNAAQFSSGLA